MFCFLFPKKLGLFFKQMYCIIPLTKSKSHNELAETYKFHNELAEDVLRNLGKSFHAHCQLSCCHWSTQVSGRGRRGEWQCRVERLWEGMDPVAMMHTGSYPPFSHQTCTSKITNAGPRRYIIDREVCRGVGSLKSPFTSEASQSNLSAGDSVLIWGAKKWSDLALSGTNTVNSHTGPLKQCFSTLGQDSLGGSRANSRRITYT